MAWPMQSTTKDDLRIRSAGNTNSTILGVIPKGANVTVTGAPVNGWYPVTYNGKSGWSSGEWLNVLTSPPVTTPSTPPTPVPIPHTQSGTNPFLSIGSTYGSHQDWSNTPIVKDQLAPKLPRAVWERAVTQQGYGGNTRQAGIARDLFARAELGHQAASFQNPDLSFQDYVTTLGPNFIRDQLAGMTDAQKGNQYGTFSPRARWVTR